MRPVNRGPVPQTDGRPKIYAKYQDARLDLIECIGEYCSYCEMRHESAIAVEHIQPKDPGLHPELELEWTNFLLACSHCNSIKGNKDVVLDDLFWPDRDNTFLALRYGPGGVVTANSDLPSEDQAKAYNLIRLVGLDRRPGHPSASKNDLRWKYRREAWDKANLFLSWWQKDRCEDHAQAIVELVASKGYWSIWMTVFKDEPEMLRRFLDAIPGTALECFDDRCAARPRNGDQI